MSLLPSNPHPQTHIKYPPTKKEKQYSVLSMNATQPTCNLVLDHIYNMTHAVTLGVQLYRQNT